jgi:general secretion pathway protein A
MHRMRVAGLGAASPFTARELAHIHKLTGGVPRRINLLCDRALLGAYSRGQAQVDRAVVRHAAIEVFDTRRMRQASERSEVRRQLLWGSAIAVVAVGVGFGLSVWQGAGMDRGVSPGAAVELAPVRTDASTLAQVPVPVPEQSPTQARPPADVASARPATADQASIAGWADEGSALRQLARNWGIDLPAGEGCEATRRVGVACFRTQASVVLARQLDRPALIRLAGAANGVGQHALLLGIDNQHALLQLPDGRVSLPLAGLALHWRGDYLTLWRSPEGLLGPSATAAGKAWLDETLQRVPGLADVAPTAAQEARLQARLQAFQLTQGLQPDGKVGPVTMMRLNQVVGIQEPRLQLSNAAEGR